MNQLDAVRFRARRWLGSRVPRRWFRTSRVLQRVLGYSAAAGTLVVDRLGELEVEYDLDSDIGHQLFVLGTFERQEIAFFSEIVRHAPPRPVVLDIGANVGVHALAWAASRSDVRVHAFEPAPRTAEVLERNVLRNGLGERVEVVRIALSDRNGVATFHECRDNAYSGLRDTARKRVESTFEVRTSTVDDYARGAQLANIALVKIDVEGFESEVVAGATETLRRHGPDLSIEIYGGQHSNPDPERTIRMLRELDYRAFVFVGDELVPFATHDDRYYNYFFTKRAS